MILVMTGHPCLRVGCHSQRTASVAEEEEDRSGDDRMDEMFDAIWPEFEINSKDPPTLEVQKFFSMLKASEESLYEYTIVSVLAFVTRLAAIKSKSAFSYYIHVISYYVLYISLILCFL
jgi:hypothetical protein